MSLAARAAAEIEDLHAFFVRWLNAVDPDPRLTLERFTAVADPGFRLVPPSGGVLGRREVIAWLAGARASRGVPGQPFSIWTEDIEVTTLAPGLCLATYVERQSGGPGVAARRSSALFRDAPGTPNGVAWLHVHETAIEAGR